MPIVFSAIVPHPPVLIPEIGKDNLKKLAKTEAAMKKLEQDFYASKPDSLVIISPHGEVLDNAFNINLNADYKGNFKDFGDFGLELKFKSDYMTIQQIRAADEKNDKAPLVLSSREEIEYGFSVPLYFLTQHAKDIPIVPITYSALGYQEHVTFGQFLYNQLSESNKRIAVVASGDLSHKLSEDSPAGFSPSGAVFDKKFIDLIKKKDVAGLLGLDKKLIQEAEETVLRSALILLGIIQSLNTSTEVVSYESPFGVGYLVCEFKLV